MSGEREPKLDEPIPEALKLPKGERIDPEKYGKAGLRMIIDDLLLVADGVEEEDWRKLRDQALPILRKILEEKEGVMAQFRRDQAILRLGLLKDQRSLETLSNILDSPDESKRTRMRAAYALGCLENEGALLVLTKNLKEKNHTIRRQIVEAVGKVAGKEQIKLLENIAREDRSRAVRAAAYDAIKLIERRLNVHLMSPTLKRPRTVRRVVGEVKTTRR